MVSVVIGASTALAAPLLRADAAVVAVDDAAAVAIISVEGPAPRALAVFALQDPPRLVVDIPRVRWREVRSGAVGPAAGLRVGLAAPGRSRVVVDLARPARIAAVSRSGRALTFALAAQHPAAFAGGAGWPRGAPRPRPAPSPATPAKTVVIDAGHGGRDPGAVAAGLREKDLTLAAAQALAKAARRRGWRVVMTRERDVFLPLRDRVRIAQAAQATALISLHVDSAGGGAPYGGSVYTLSAAPTDARAAAFAARENAAGAGVATAFPAAPSDVSALLAALAAPRTGRRSLSLGRALADALAELDAAIPSRPLRAAGFAVLRAPEVPSVLVELGFLSSPRDRARLTDPDAVAAAAEALAEALTAWWAETSAAAEFTR